MTEQNWLIGTDPSPMLEFLRSKVSDRQLRLFGVACYRRLWDRLDAIDRQYIEAAELIADDGRSRQSEVSKIMMSRQGMTHSIMIAVYPARDVAEVGANRARVDLMKLRGIAAYHRNKEPNPEWDAAIDEEGAAQSLLLRCIFGNPFRPVIADAAWLSPTVVSLAEAIYAERAFDRLPILADALEESGCGHADVLAHCRSDGPHVRGCWVVDLILGKS